MTLKPQNSLIRPVFTQEFYHEVKRAWRLRVGQNGKENALPRNIALAVSGGPDSMALAHLCRRLIVEGHIPDLNVKAFIVDHKAREKSTDEALKVAGWIKSMGLKSQVLTLQWPEGTKDPARLPNFETLARRLRYQALGTACVTENIRALFLGHHRDDNVETALLRLAQGHGRFGLAGFDSVSPIPECHSLWGVSQSGDITSIEAISADRTPRMAPIKPNLMNNGGDRAPLPQPDSSLYTATGGVYIFRPFRSFPKARLEATCRVARVPFVIDPTNEDHTLTIRNTVRKLLSSGDLPRALQSPSILAFISKNQRAKERLQDLTDSFLKLVRVNNFDFSSGTLLVRLPFAEEVDFFKETFNDPHQDHPHINPFDVQLKVVRTLIELVTPESDLQVSQEGLVRAAKLLWPRSSEDTSSPDVFTLGGVQFQPQKRKGKYGVFPHSFKRRSQDALIASQNLRDVADNPTDPNIWLLSREPLRRHLPPPITKFGICLPDPVPEQINKAGWQSVNKSRWTQWKLWDGRYWVRLRATRQNKTLALKGGATPKAHIYSFGDTIQVTMKPMSQEDVVGIRRSELGNPFYQCRSSWKLTDRDLRPESYTGGRRLDASRWKKKAFDVLLSCFAPGNLRKTIPVLWHSTPETIQPEEGIKEALSIHAGCNTPPASDPEKIEVDSPEDSPSASLPPTSKCSRNDVAKATAGFPEGDDINDEGRYGNGEYEEERHYNINDTQKLVAVPSFHRRTGKKIWVRMPRKSIQAPSNDLTSPKTVDQEQDPDEEYICPWIIEWDIIFKHVDPVTIRCMNWERKLSSSSPSKEESY
ncbi:hypothetical protein D8B26_007599 [Coccidioides posadasii str. Silveira]|uniref:tRNA(Ile)-lysidine synthetase n=3 Tax=Coccidioides posadasii TaxID=199306 RepID=E9D2E7_COCPS|nr:PP-loop family protein [Coccidioides posadasii C735 delta SOWgp]EER25011.1 PP-loop family protein [Coccidioides posadasii C735 delta SOWgp]EFW19361.1 conserved hypothetical protein [Coccidioides posadasii str. Silveira]KMM71820.1 tRNA(Ile)-lysidine synthetase family [Coccidioides posadasii RMSCC 3488]QVM12982.1 hypothetical protein D8B26_007599 [Coccidioides posadasii str. Silveira]|eukprot:XP_003067156.1 PP-loop family protein [Coccidioides posadasii C735 delta SOWgp]